MVTRREVNWTRLLLAFLIGTFLFCVGILIGFLAKGIILDNTATLEEDIRTDIVNIETLSLLEESFPCNDEIIKITSQRLDYLGELITSLEGSEGKNSPTVLELKKLYTVLETRHFLLMENRNEQCGSNNNIILFFYSNAGSCLAESEGTSFVLTYLRNKYDNVKIYSFDLDLDSEIVTALKSEYEINGCTGVVLNQEKVLYTIEQANQIEPLLQK